MDKGQVLDIMDSPKRTERKHGQDRWTYFVDNDKTSDPVIHDQKLEKHVYFENGKATYVGDPIAPTISADEQDRINEEQNIALQNAAARRANENKKNNTNKRSTQSTETTNNSTDGTQANEKSSNNDSQKKYLPEFSPVQ